MSNKRTTSLGVPLRRPEMRGANGTAHGLANSGSMQAGSLDIEGRVKLAVCVDIEFQGAQFSTSSM